MAAFELAELYVQITSRDAAYWRSLSSVRRATDRASVAMRASMIRATAGMRQAFTRFGQVAGRIMGKLVRWAKRAALGLVAIGVASVVAFGKFERAMARVGALSQATTEELDALTTKARELGRSTVFAATEAAEAMSAFALAGFSVEEMLLAVGPTLDLAAAAQLGMGEAAEIAAGIMRSMAIDVEDLTHVMDVIAKTFTTSMTTAQTLGETMRMLGPIAQTSGQSLESVMATIGILGNNMIRGSMAGVQLKNVLIRLQAQPNEVAKSLRNLGIVVSREDGSMRNLSYIIDDLNESMAEMGDVERAAIIARLGGMRSVAGLTILMREGGDAIREYQRRLILSDGTNREVADTMRDTLWGSFKLMISAVTDLGIAIGEVLSPAMRKLAGWASKLANTLRKSMSGTREAWLDAFKGMIGDFVWFISRMEMLGVSLELVFAKMAQGFEQIGRDLTQLLNNIIAGIPMLIGVAVGAIEGMMKNFPTFDVKASDTPGTVAIKIIKGLAVQGGQNHLAGYGQKVWDQAMIRGSEAAKWAMPFDTSGGGKTGAASAIDARIQELKDEMRDIAMDVPERTERLFRKLGIQAGQLGDKSQGSWLIGAGLLVKEIIPILKAEAEMAIEAAREFIEGARREGAAGPAFDVDVSGVTLPKKPFQTQMFGSLKAFSDAIQTSMSDPAKEALDLQKERNKIAKEQLKEQGATTAEIKKITKARGLAIE